ncbi:MAG: peptidase domain-containing ABC transporter [Pseudomonadales bacterium]|nr:peptidase domain-containing ABC transporter [Pseudomonadales bacterium]
MGLSFPQTSRKLPVILQAEKTECGLACLAMVAAYYGHRVDLNTLRHEHPVSSRGATLGQLLQVADALHLQSRALRVDMEEIRQIRTPAILHWDLDHFVVLRELGRRHARVHDPATGEHRLTLAELGRHFTGVAIESVPGKAFCVQTRQRRSRLRELFAVFPGFYASLLQLFVLSLLIQLVGIGAAFYLQLVIDESITKADVDLLTVLSTGFGLLMLSRVGMSFLRGTVQMAFASLLGFQMAGNVMTHLMKLPVDFFLKRHVGDLVSRFAGVQEIRQLLSEDLITAVLDGLMASLTLLVLFVFDARLALIVTVFVVLSMTLKLGVVAPMRARTEQIMVAEAKANSTFMESLRGIEMLKFCCRELPRIRHWRHQLAEQVNAGVQLRRLTLRVEAAYGVIAALEHILVVTLAARAVLAGQMTLGFMSAFLALRSQFSASVSSLIDRLVQMRMMSLQLERISDITCAPAEFTDFHVTPAEGRICELSLVGVGYCYAGDPRPVLQEVSLHIATGEIIAITGASGSGKSTLLKLLAGLLQPSSGELLVNGESLHAERLRRHRHQCAGVLQSDQLLSGTLRDNITLYDDEVDELRLQQAAAMAGIQNFIQSLPMGYHSLVGDMGSMLSAGQAQRILLARAFYARASLLLLDEATANLDQAVENQVLQSVRALGITTVMITHRAAPLRIASRVLQCHEGRVTEVPREAGG